MGDDDISTCSGTFWDSGYTSNYYGSENDTITICSDDGTLINFYFHYFKIFFYSNLRVYDGPSTDSEMIESIYGMVYEPFHIISTGNCLTFVLNLNNNTTEGQGWEADIYCTFPCQTFDVTLDHVQPMVDDEFLICITDSLNINVITDYINNDLAYHQSDDNTIFKWILSERDTFEGQNFSHLFSNDGFYNLELYMQDINECVKTEYLTIRVIDVSGIFAATISPDSICLNDTLNIVYNVDYPAYFSNNSNPIPEFISAYVDSIYFDNLSGEIMSGDDIKSICINMEHSYAGDLDIRIKCPNGQTATINPYPSGLGSAYFGEPCDVYPVQGSIGVGYEYCFTDGADSTLLDAYGLYTHTYVSNDGDTITNKYFPSGEYNITGDFNDLVGCPLNGAWTLIITDNLQTDDGYVFYWSLDFGLNDPAGNSEIWERNWTIESANPNDFVSMNDSLLFIPQDTGSYYIHYELTSVAGCGVDTVIGPITVLSNLEVLEIWGDQDVETGDIEVYSLLNESTNLIEWHVEGGTIIEEYSGDSIQVEWTEEANLVMVTSENANGCNSIDILYISPTEVSELMQSDIKLYPNPSQGLITIEMDSEQNKSLTIINARGTVVLQDQLEDIETTINLSHLSTGMYLVLVDGQYAQKLILE